MFHRSAARRATPTADREVFRLIPPVILWWVWLAFVVANIAGFAIQGAPGSSARFVIVVAAILATVTGLAYALALRPCVIADQIGLAIVNPFRDHRVPWAAIRTVDTGDWVRVHYALDGDAPGTRTKSISCWALYVSARTKRQAARPPRHAGGSLLPEEAKFLASLPVVKAVAARLDARALKERARAEHTGSVTARWAWPPLAAVALPALALLIIALA